MPDIDILKQLNSLSHIVLSEHARTRLIERNISVEDIVEVLRNGEIIMQYEDDKPFPSCLILGNDLKGNKTHIVVSNDEEFIYLITAYYPDSIVWNDDFRKKRGK